MAKLIKQSIIDQISLETERIINQFVTHSRRNAKEAWYLSPFNSSDSNPSFKIDLNKRVWYDHSVQDGGNGINFIMKYENRSFREAVLRAGEILDITIEYTDDDPAEQDPIYLTNWKYAKWCHQRLLQNAEALDYLLSRGITIDTIEAFQLGVHDIDLPIKAKDRLLDAGLINSGGKWVFKDRITFPFITRSKRIIGFSGRVYPEGKNPYKPDAKYLNTRETRLFQKKNYLYGLGVNFMNIRKRCIPVEGPMDVCVAHSNGHKYLVAYQSSVITQEQAKTISNLSNSIIYFPDPDIIEKKPNLIARAYKHFMGHGAMPNMISAPDKMDMADVCEQVDDINQFIVDHLIGIDDLIESLTLEEKEEEARKLIASCGALSDPVKRKIIAARISKKLAATSDEVLAMFTEKVDYDHKPEQAKESSSPEKQLVHYMIHHSDEIPEIIEQLQFRPLINDSLEEMINLLQVHPAEHLATAANLCQIYAEMMCAQVIINTKEELSKLIKRVNIDVIQHLIEVKQSDKTDGNWKEVMILQDQKKRFLQLA